MSKIILTSHNDKHKKSTKKSAAKAVKNKGKIMVVVSNPKAGTLLQDAAGNVSGSAKRSLRLLVTSLETPNEALQGTALAEAIQSRHNFVLEQESLSQLMGNMIGGSGALGASNGASFYFGEHSRYLRAEFPQEELHKIMNDKGGLRKTPLPLSPLDKAMRARRDALTHLIGSTTSERRQWALGEVLGTTAECQRIHPTSEQKIKGIELVSLFAAQRNSLLLPTDNQWQAFHKDSGREKFSEGVLNKTLDPNGNLLSGLIPEPATSTRRKWKLPSLFHR